MKTKTKNKKPIAIIFLIIWMAYMVFRGILKAINYQRIDTNKQIFGTFAIFDYGVDILLMVAFIVLIFLFIKRVPKSWKYFIYLSLFMILGIVVGTIYNFIAIDRIVSVLTVQIPPKIFLISNVIGSTLLIVFYCLLIYLAYRNRNYFKRSKK